MVAKGILKHASQVHMKTLLHTEDPAPAWTNRKLEIGTASTLIPPEHPEQFIYLCLARRLPNKERDSTDLLRHSCSVPTVAIASYCTASLWRNHHGLSSLISHFIFLLLWWATSYNYLKSPTHRSNFLDSRKSERYSDISHLWHSLSPQTFLKSHFNYFWTRRNIFSMKTAPKQTSSSKNQSFPHLVLKFKFKGIHF